MFAIQEKFWSSILERVKRRWFLRWIKATKYNQFKSWHICWGCIYDIMSDWKANSEKLNYHYLSVLDKASLAKVLEDMCWYNSEIKVENECWNHEIIYYVILNDTRKRRRRSKGILFLHSFFLWLYRYLSTWVYQINFYHFPNYLSEFRNCISRSFLWVSVL